MFHLFEGKTADEVWRQAASRLIGAKPIPLQNSRAGTTRELLHAAFTIQDPRQRWIASRRPAINPAFAIAEVVWILNGRKDADFLNYWNPQLPRYAGHGPSYPGAYGYRLRRHFGIDQLERAYQALLHNPDSRQVVLQIWDGTVDLPDEVGHPAHTDIPCNVTAFLKVREGKLEWMQVLRSNDLYRGVPYNIVQFTFLQEVMAGWLGVEVGAYHQLSDSLHLYTTDAGRLRLDNEVAATNTDSVSLSKAESDDVLMKLNNYMDELIRPDLTEATLQSSLTSVELPTAYQNMLYVVAAEAARRRGWIDMASELMAGCMNPALQQLWSNWLDRVLPQRQKLAEVVG